MQLIYSWMQISAGELKRDVSVSPVLMERANMNVCGILFMAFNWYNNPITLLCDLCVGWYWERISVMEKLHTFLFTSKGKILENAKSLGMLLSKRWTICMPAEHEMDCQCIFILNPLLNLKNKSIYFILIHLYSLFSFPSLFPSCPPFSSTLFILPTVCTRDSIVRI